MREEYDHDEIQGCDDQQRHGLNVRLRADDLAALGQIVDGHIAGDGRFLQQHDKLVRQRGQHVFERLRNDDIDAPESKMLVVEENMARALTLRWGDYDLAKAVSY